jgi:hypothetical protein
VTNADDGKESATETGTTAGVDHDDGTATETGTKTNDDVATVEIAEAGTDVIRLFGTLDGTSDHWMIATDGDEAGMITAEAGIDDGINEAGTTTTDDQVDGTVTVAGIETETELTQTELTHCETGTLTIAELGIEAITENETDDGMFDQATITADGDEAIVITKLAGKLETNDAGTTAGVDHDDGTATDAGTKTNDDVATVEIAEAGTDVIRLFGTELGTLDHSMIATDGDEAGMITAEAGSDDGINEAGTTTTDDQVDGTVTVAGTETETELTHTELTHCDTGTLTTAELGTVAITENGTLFGMLVHATMTADDSEAIVITSLSGKLETNEAGTTAGELNDDGIATVAGT